MFVSAALSGVRRIENSVGEQYLSGVRRTASIDYRSGLYAMRTRVVGRQERVLRKVRRKADGL